MTANNSAQLWNSNYRHKGRVSRLSRTGLFIGEAVAYVQLLWKRDVQEKWRRTSMMLLCVCMYNFPPMMYNCPPLAMLQVVCTTVYNYRRFNICVYNCPYSFLNFMWIFGFWFSSAKTLNIWTDEVSIRLEIYLHYSTI